MADQKLKDKTSEEQSSELMKHATKQSYCPQLDEAAEKTHAGHHAMDNCIELFKLDYDVELIDNKGAKLCGHYPSQIVLMGEKDSGTSAIKGKDGQNLPLKEAREELEVVMERAAPSRCRSRFVTPVIYVGGQYVCRSATLAESKELAMRLATESLSSAADAVASAAGAVASTAGSAVASILPPFLLTGSAKYIPSLFWTDGKTEKSDKNPPEDEEGEEEEEVPSSRAGPSEPAEMEDEASRSQYEEYFRIKVQKDKELLNKLNVLHICDLMVEDAKVKFGLTVSSSEKADVENRYKDFNLYSFPYPGCEFFAVWNSKKRQARGLHYDWNNPQNTAVLNVGEERSILRQMDIDWSNQREWDLMQVTQNYVQALVRLVAEGEQGLLVHCISGWDRTPLFISLLRLSLWADGLVHQSLGPSEILYLTLAYDWYLFGRRFPFVPLYLSFTCCYLVCSVNINRHQYAARKRKGQEVLPFCFYMLPNLVDRKYSAFSYAEYPGMESPNERSTTPAQQRSVAGRNLTPEKAPSPSAKQTSPLAVTGQVKAPKSGALSKRLIVPKGQEPSVRYVKGQGGSAKSSPAKATSSPPAHPRAKSQSPGKSSVPAQAAAAVAAAKQTSSKQLGKLSTLSLDAPRKRTSEVSRSEIVPSPAKKVTQRISEVFGTMGELLHQQMNWMFDSHESPKAKRQTKENVDPNVAEGVASTSEEASKLPPEIVVKDVDEEEDPHPELEEGFEALRSDKWHKLPERHKRLLTVSFIFHSVQARCEGLHLKQEAEMDQAVKDYAFGSITSSLFNAFSWQQVFFFFNSGKSSGSNPDTGEAGAETGETDTGETGSETGEAGLETGETANPEMEQSFEVIETESEDPNVVVTGPETGEAGPETGETGPGTGETGPETGEAGPETGETGPGTGETGPGTGETANPEMNRSFEVLETESADPNVVKDHPNRQTKLGDTAVTDLIKDAMGDLWNEEKQGQGKAGETSSKAGAEKATEEAAKTRQNVSDTEEPFELV